MAAAALPSGARAFGRGAPAGPCAGASGPRKPDYGETQRRAASPGRSVGARRADGTRAARWGAGERGRCPAALRLRAAAPWEAASGAALRHSRDGPAAGAAAAAARRDAPGLVLQAGAEPGAEPSGRVPLNGGASLLKQYTWHKPPFWAAPERVTRYPGIRSFLPRGERAASRMLSGNRATS